MYDRECTFKKIFQEVTIIHTPDVYVVINNNDASSRCTCINKTNYSVPLSVKFSTIMAGAGAKPFVDAKIAQRKVLMFTKKQSADCRNARDILESYKLKFPTYEVVEIESRQDCAQIENYFQIICQTDTRSVSQNNEMII